MHWQGLARGLTGMPWCSCCQHVGMHGLQPCALKTWKPCLTNVLPLLLVSALCHADAPLLQGIYFNGAGCLRMQHLGCKTLGGKLPDNHSSCMTAQVTVSCAPASVDAPVTAVTLGAGGHRVSWKCWMAAAALSGSVRQDVRGCYADLQQAPLLLQSPSMHARYPCIWVRHHSCLSWWILSSLQGTRTNLVQPYRPELRNQAGSSPQERTLFRGVGQERQMLHGLDERRVAQAVLQPRALVSYRV